MGIIRDLFSWITANDKNGKEFSVGYVLEHEPKSLHDIQKSLKAFGLEKYTDQVLPLVRDSIVLHIEPRIISAFQHGQSRFGGTPDLEESIDWPKNELGEPLSFVAQLNCEEISVFDKSGLLPKTGLLSFFYCAEQHAWGFEPDNYHRFKVMFTENTAALTRRGFPGNLEENARFYPNMIIPESSLSLPSFDDELIEQLFEDDDRTKYIDLVTGYQSQLLGYADNIQGTMELDCHLMSQGITHLEWSESDAKENSLEGKDDWILLFQVNSEEEKANMMWGADGMLYFWIRKQDLAARNFEKVWCILQCT